MVGYPLLTGMTAEKVKETLKREEKYFVEIQRAAEQQLTILKVHVQKWDVWLLVWIHFVLLGMDK